MNTLEQITSVSPLEKFRQGLENTVKTETSGNNLDVKMATERANLDQLLAKSQTLPPLNEEALQLATSEQKISVESVITAEGLFAMSEKQLIDLRKTYEKSTDPSDKVRLAATDELLGYNKSEVRLEDQEAGLIKSLRNSFKIIFGKNN